MDGDEARVGAAGQPESGQPALPAQAASGSRQPVSEEQGKAGQGNQGVVLTGTRCIRTSTCQLGCEQHIRARGIDGDKGVCWDVNDSVWVQLGEGWGVKWPLANLSSIRHR